MSPYPVGSPDAYQKAMDQIDWLAEKYAIDPRVVKDIRDLYDRLYWLVKDKAKLEALLADAEAQLRALKEPRSTVGCSTSVLIPATYKPVTPLK